MTYTDTPWPAGTPCWVDLTVPDLQAAREFYGPVVGWDFADTGEEFGHYTLCQVEGRAAAGLGPVPQEGTPSAWTLYFATPDLDATAKQVGEHGGTLVAGPMDIPRNGRMAVAADPTGAAFGLWQADGRIGTEIVNEPGSLVWEDGRVADVARAREFYTALFGYYAPVPGVPWEVYGTADLAGRPVGGLGGMFDAPAGTPSHWLVYFGVVSTDAAVAAATAGGGRVVSPAADSPFGRMATVADPFGAVFALHQPPGTG
ncbi:VOC family protein [Pseudonocardia xishanensis]|uniref:VOC family protein n=1 Tax=Pseudonocardia xishanensis TaxID=630995 RepID=A0ABP8RN46_9PSEU